MEQSTSGLTSVKEGVLILNVSPFALYRKIQNGELPAYRFGRKVLIDLHQEVKEAMRVKSGTPNMK